MLATLQAADLVYTELSPKFGSAHLDHLGVPTWLRPLLPVIKGAAVIGLLLPRIDRRFVGLPLVSYYSAATTFHVLSDDPIDDVVPAAFCAGMAAIVAVSRPA